MKYINDDSGGSALNCIDEEPNTETLAAFEDIEAGRNIIGPFDDVGSFFDALLRDD